VNRALDIVPDMLKEHEGMEENLSPRVYLRHFNDASIGIFLIYWYDPPNCWDYLAFSEHLNLRIVELFEAWIAAVRRSVGNLPQP